MRENSRGIPGYLRLVGAAMLACGVVGLGSQASMALGTNAGASGIVWALEGLLAIAGLGLLLARRWGWLLTLLEAIVGLAIAIPQVVAYRATSALSGILVQILLSALILFALFTPRSLAWVRAGREVGPGI